MKRGLIVLIFLALATVVQAFAVFACTVPENGMAITNDTRLCTGVYELPDGIHLAADNITLDCAGSVLKGDFKGRGLWIEHLSGVSVKNCHILHFRIGIYVRNSTQIFLFDNHLVRNLEGLRLVDVQNSTIWLTDVSLQTPINILASEQNFVAFANKRIPKEACGWNYCNILREVIERRLGERPKLWFEDWFKSMLV